MNAPRFQSLKQWKKDLPRDTSPQMFAQLAEANDSAFQMLGRARVADTASALGGVTGAAEMDLTCLPTMAMAVEDFTFPQTADEFAATFENQYYFLNFTRSNGTGIRSNTFAQGAQVLAPTLVAGLGAVMRYTPNAATIQGATFTRPADGAGLPHVFLPMPVTGLPDVTSPAISNPATLEVGGPVWDIVVALMYNTNIMYVLGQQLILVNQPLVNVGFIEAMAGYKGFGTSYIALTQIVADVNARLKAMGADFVFMPPTITAMGASSVGLPPPIAEVQRGGPVNPGAYGACGSFPLVRHMLLPGQNYQIFLENQGSSVWNDLLRTAAVLPTGLTPYVPNQPNTTALSGSGGTLQAAAWNASFALRTGTLQFGIGLRGATLMPTDALVHYMTFGMPLLSSWDDQVAGYNYMRKLATQCGLNGTTVAKPMVPGDPRFARHGGALAGFQKPDLTVADKNALLKQLWDDKGDNDEFHFAAPADIEKAVRLWAPPSR